MHDRLETAYTCTTICRVTLEIDRLAATIGPARDTLYVPMRIRDGTITGVGNPKAVTGGSDFATMYADEILVHDGNLVFADPDGDVLLWYDGPSQGREGAYDELLDERLPGRIPCRFAVRIVSSNPQWRPFSRRPLLGLGSFDGQIGKLDFVILSVIAYDRRNALTCATCGATRSAIPSSSVRSRTTR